MIGSLGENVLKWIESGEIVIDSGILFKMYDTYGFPPELTKKIINDFFKENEAARVRAIIWAYDTAKGTHYLDRLR